MGHQSKQKSLFSNAASSGALSSTGVPLAWHTNTQSQEAITQTWYNSSSPPRGMYKKLNLSWIWITVYFFGGVWNIKIRRRKQETRGGESGSVFDLEYSFHWPLRSVIYHACSLTRVPACVHSTCATDQGLGIIYYLQCEVISIIVQLAFTEPQLSNVIWIRKMSTSVTPLTYFPSFSLTHWPRLQVDLHLRSCTLWISTSVASLIEWPVTQQANTVYCIFCSNLKKTTQHMFVFHFKFALYQLAWIHRIYLTPPDVAGPQCTT